MKIIYEFNEGSIKPEENALIYAGASGVGTALIQLINHFKANPIAFTSTDKKCDFCNRL